MKRFDIQDNAIRGTNDEASVSKAAVVSKGYYRDDFVSFFIHGPPVHPPPLMNRGYYARVKSIETIVKRFLGCCEGIPNKRQVVNLGCGFDTLYFRLCAYDNDILQALEDYRFFDVDFEQVIAKKKTVVTTEPAFKSFLEHYTTVACDLRNASDLSELMQSNGFEDVPTIFLSECALIYMEPKQGSSVISWAAKSCQVSAFVTYEQIRPNDAFGKVMIRNLQARSIPLHSLMQYPDLEAQMERYKSSGYTCCNGRTMLDVYKSFLGDNTRIERLEKFDEWEEWDLVLSHYCLVFACTNEHLFQKIKF